MLAVRGAGSNTIGREGSIAYRFEYCELLYATEGGRSAGIAFPNLTNNTLGARLVCQSVGGLKTSTSLIQTPLNLVPRRDYFFDLRFQYTNRFFLIFNYCLTMLIGTTYCQARQPRFAVNAYCVGFSYPNLF